MFALAAAFQTEGATRLINSVDWSKPTWDLFIVLFFLVAAFLYGLSLGRDRIVVILVSIYMALAVINTAPKEVIVPNFFVLRISAFLGVFLVLFFLLSRSALIHSIAASDSKGPWWQVILFSVLHVGLLISITVSFLPDTAVATLSPITRKIFAEDLASFLWILAPILAMIVIRGGASKDKKYKYDL